jgi:hypothetical protein
MKSGENMNMYHLEIEKLLNDKLFMHYLKDNILNGVTNPNESIKLAFQRKDKTIKKWLNIINEKSVREDNISVTSDRAKEVVEFLAKQIFNEINKK